MGYFSMKNAPMEKFISTSGLTCKSKIIIIFNLIVRNRIKNYLCVYDRHF